MVARFDPLTALEGSFRGFPFRYARERKPGGQRGPLHEYPDRDVPYFEGTGRKAKQFDLSVYFVALTGDPTGSTADLQADAFERLLYGGKPGPLILGLRRETVWARSWDRERTADKGGWVRVDVSFIEAGRNQYPASETSWPHTLLAEALAARTAFGEALAAGLGLDGLSLEAQATLVESAGVLAGVMDVAAQLAGGDAPSSALAAAGLLTSTFLAGLPGIDGPLDIAAFAAATVALVGNWADALAGASPDSVSLGRAVDALFTLYGEAASDSWYAAGTLTPTQTAEIANQAALSGAVRRLALAEAARLTASIAFASYDDAVALRDRFADAFDDEVDGALAADGSRSALASLQARTLLAISAAGADKARLVPYRLPRPRTAIGMAQLFYPDDADVAARAAELVARNGVIHPAFMPSSGERLSA